jgi:hypothetical protein
MFNFQSGDLVLVLDVPDQSFYIKSFAGEYGLVLENIPQNSSKNIWKVLVRDTVVNFHSLDLKKRLLRKENEMNNDEKTMISLSAIRVGHWNALVYQEMTKGEVETMIEQLAEEAACHTDDCPWWNDWHACNCNVLGSS